LAVSFALLGKKVLLVGLDIRRPRLSNLFGLNKSKTGITNILIHDNPTLEMIREQIIPSEINDNLELMMAGPVPPNPTEIVSRSSLDRIFEVLRKEYDYVIVDTAPVGLVTDTLQIGRVADVTCVICRADYTEKAAFRIINDFAINKKLPSVCIAINGIDMSKKKYGYAYGYGRYGKYGKYGYRGYRGYSKYGSYYGYNSYGYGGYGSYGYHSYGYGSYADSHYGNPNDDSIKK
jgi:capsular exopolysaccharide synthesis family protein